MSLQDIQGFIVRPFSYRYVRKKVVTNSNK